MNKFRNKILSEKLIYILLTVIFFTVLAVFFITSVIAEDRDFSEAENRNLAKQPVFSVTSVMNGKFMTDIESYLSDQFAFRDAGVAVKTVFSRILGKSSVNGVYIGKDNRLYEIPSVVNEKTLDATINSIISFSENCEIENKYVLMIPNATQIIPENLPDFLTCDSQIEIIDGIYNRLSDEFSCIDCVEPLISCENRDKLFLKTDHHWTADAAKIIFDEFSDTAKLDTDNIKYENIVFSNSFFGTLSSSAGIYEVPDSLEAVIPVGTDGKYVVRNYQTQTKSSSVLDVDSVYEKNQYEVFFGGNYSRIKISTCNANGKNILIFKDSYANCFIPMLIPHYENIVIVDPRYFTGNICDVLDDMDFTDLMFLYNLNTFLEDTVLDDVLDVY